MAIHSKQGRRSGGSKKNSRRGYGKVWGAASNGGGSEAKTATNHAKHVDVLAVKIAQAHRPTSIHSREIVEELPIHQTVSRKRLTTSSQQSLI